MILPQQPVADPIERLFAGHAALTAFALSLGLLAAGIALSKLVARWLGRRIPAPETPPPPPPLPEGARRFSPLARAVLAVVQRLGHGPPPSFRPLLLPATLLFMLIAESAGVLVVRASAGAPAPPDASDPPNPPDLNVPDVLDLGRFAIAAAVHAVVLAVLLAAWTRRFGGGLADLGLAWRGAGRAVLLAVALYVAYAPVQLGALGLERSLWAMAGRPMPQQAAVTALLSDPGLLRAGVVASLVLCVPFYEELLFRGVLQRFWARLLPRGRPWLAIAATALVFTVVHDAGWMPVFALGVALSWLFWRTGSLLAPLSFHVLHNGLMLWLLA